MQCWVCCKWSVGLLLHVMHPSCARVSLQVSVSTRYEQRLEEGNLRNYGRMIVDLASVVPDGLVVFFVSYSYMDYVIARWHEEGLLEELMAHKLIFIETQVRGQVRS